MNLPSASGPPPVTEPHIDVYKRVSDTPGFAYMAMCHPIGERAVKAFADDQRSAVGQVKRLLGVKS